MHEQVEHILTTCQNCLRPGNYKDKAIQHSYLLRGQSPLGLSCLGCKAGSLPVLILQLFRHAVQGSLQIMHRSVYNCVLPIVSLVGSTPATPDWQHVETN